MTLQFSGRVRTMVSRMSLIIRQTTVVVALCAAMVGLTVSPAHARVFIGIGIPFYGPAFYPPPVYYPPPPAYYAPPTVYAPPQSYTPSAEAATARVTAVKGSGAARTDGGGPRRARARLTSGKRR
jgi:hypothetical protein